MGLIASIFSLSIITPNNSPTKSQKLSPIQIEKSKIATDLNEFIYPFDFCLFMP